MLKTYGYIERRFVRNEHGEIIGVEPVSVREKMVYTDEKMNVPFSYDTRTHTEEDIQNVLRQYPSFLSRLFRNAMSYFSRQIWRMRR